MVHRQVVSALCGPLVSRSHIHTALAEHAQRVQCRVPLPQKSERCHATSRCTTKNEQDVDIALLLAANAGHTAQQVQDDKSRSRACMECMLNGYVSRSTSLLDGIS